MALTPQSNEAFLREVDDELRRDQLLTVWERYGRWIIAAIVAGLAIFAGVLFWQHRQDQAAGIEGETLQKAYDDLGAGQPAAATASLAELAGSKRDGYRALATFSQGDILLGRQDTKGAAAKFASIATDAGLPQPFRDLALIRQTVAEFDALKPQVVVDRLRSLTVPGNAWFGSAGELTAVAYLRMGRRDLAATLFGQIARDENVPDSLRQRAVQMAGVLGVDAVPQNQDTKTR